MRILLKIWTVLFLAHLAQASLTPACDIFPSPKDRIFTLLTELKSRIEAENMETPERLARTKEISELIVKTLQPQGIVAEVFENMHEGHPFHSYMVKIASIRYEDRQSMTKSQKVIGATNTRFKNSFIFVPYLQAQKPATLATHFPGGVVALPIESIVDGTLAHEMSGLHEIRHLKLTDDLKKGILTPFHGLLEANKGRYLTSTYPDRLSFQELATLYRALRQRRAGVPISLPFAYRGDGFEISSERQIASTLWEAATIIIETNNWAEKDVTSDYRQKDIKFDVDPEFNQVRAVIQTDAGLRFGPLATYWLVKATDPQDRQRNLKLLEEYLDSTTEAAKFYLAEARRFLRY